ncbi:SemiSWEET family sugar transporter [Bdellovibrio sp. HCB185ZH]|uniref:SemiSWEET family sugar transporter n=1 Tax=Bdellovibrio sp. HCB185ZH TaxID=3394235 RepID=UPI0039A59222
MDSVTLLGLIAGACTSLCGIPQVLKILKTRSGKDISYKTYLILSFGTALWIVFGVIQDEIAIILTNAVNLIINAVLLGLKLKFGDSHRTTPQIHHI